MPSPITNGTGRGEVHVISRRVVHAEPPPAPSPAPRTIHLTPLDLRMLSPDYIQKGALLPKPRLQPADELVDRLASAFARALGRFHPFAGRLAVDERAAADGTVTVSLRCTLEAALVGESVKRWARAPRLAYNTDMLGVAAVGTGSSPRFDVYGNDFGWGEPPLAVRSGPGNKLDGKISVFEGRGGGGGAMALEVCLAPDALARLVADAEFMDAVTVP